MIDNKKLKTLVQDYDEQHQKDKPNYNALRDRLIRLVDKFGAESVSTATGLTVSTVKQHYRNCTGSSMIAEYRLKRAETLLPKCWVKGGE